MHSKAMKAYDCLESDVSADTSMRLCVPQRHDIYRRERHTRRWCAVGFIAIPVVVIFLWLQYFSARSSGGLLFGADRICNCRALATRLASDDFWTQMIWMPSNTFFLLIWVALGVKLWNGKRRRLN